MEKIKVNVDSLEVELPEEASVTFSVFLHITRVVIRKGDVWVSVLLHQEGDNRVEIKTHASCS